MSQQWSYASDQMSEVLITPLDYHDTMFFKAKQLVGA
jgi:hypothetical protein